MSEPLLLGNEAISAAISSGNINIAGNIQVEVMELSEESKQAQLAVKYHIYQTTHKSA